MRSLREVFSGFVRKPVLVAEHHQFIANALDAPLEWQYASTTLRNVLEELRRREKSATLPADEVDGIHTNGF